MNLNLVIDTSHFKPFEYYNAALQTMKDYGTEYRRLEDLMMKIAELNGQYVLPDTPENQEYRGVMDRYNADYNAVVDDFSKGMNLENARRIRELRKRYYNEVAPINRAIEAYNKDQDKMTALGPDAIIGNKLRTIRDYYGGVNPGISYRSGKAIQQTAAGVVQRIDNALMQAPELAGSIAKLYFVLKLKGLNGNDALAEILKNSQLSSRQDITDASLLIQALDGVYQQYAFDDGTPENSKVWKNVVTGAIQGILAPKYSLQTDNSYESDAQRASREHTETQTAYYRTGKELDEMKKWLDLGYIPQTDELGNIARDKNGNILYELNIEEAAKRKKQLNSSSGRGGTSTPSVSKPPAGYVEFIGSDGKKYAVKNKGSEYYIQLESIIYTLDDLGNWILVPADETELRTKISNEARGLLQFSPTETKDDKEKSPYGNKKSGNPAR